MASNGSIIKNVHLKRYPRYLQGVMVRNEQGDREKQFKKSLNIVILFYDASKLQRFFNFPMYVLISFLLSMVSSKTYFAVSYCTNMQQKDVFSSLTVRKYVLPVTVRGISDYSHLLFSNLLQKIPHNVFRWHKQSAEKLLINCCKTCLYLEVFCWK